MDNTTREPRGKTLTSRILNLAFQYKAQQLGIEKYSIARLALASGLNHSVIVRAAKYDATNRDSSRPMFETVNKMVEALAITRNSELEDAFYNAFSYASPRQQEHVQSYLERVVQES